MFGSPALVPYPDSQFQLRRVCDRGKDLLLPSSIHAGGECREIETAALLLSGLYLAGGSSLTL